MMHTEGLLFSIQKSRLNSGVIKILVKKGSLTIQNQHMTLFLKKPL